MIQSIIEDHSFKKITHYQCNSVSNTCDKKRSMQIYIESEELHHDIVPSTITVHRWSGAL